MKRVCQGRGGQVILSDRTRLGRCASGRPQPHPPSTQGGCRVGGASSERKIDTEIGNTASRDNFDLLVIVAADEMTWQRCSR